MSINNRYVGVLFLLPLVIFLFAGGTYIKFAAMVLSIMGMYEFYKVSKQGGYHPISIVGYVLCVIYYFLLNKNINFETIIFLIIISLIVLLCIPVINTSFSYLDAALTITGFLYVAVLFSYIYLINIKTYGRLLMWLIFISSWACDITAYYVGKSFGKNKLCPEVSPNKTIEGAVGGFLGSTIACGILGYYFNTKGITVPLYNYIIIGALCGIMCQFGDLCASSIKRHSGVKDYSHIIPGHGGILDRFDSILFASAVVYYYITLILGI